MRAGPYKGVLDVLGMGEGSMHLLLLDLHQQMADAGAQGSQMVQAAWSCSYHVMSRAFQWLVVGLVSAEPLYGAGIQQRAAHSPCALLMYSNDYATAIAAIAGRTDTWILQPQVAEDHPPTMHAEHKGQHADSSYSSSGRGPLCSACLLRFSDQPVLWTAISACRSFSLLHQAAMTAVCDLRSSVSLQQQAIYCGAPHCC
jgi:hypothetical protein